MGVGVGVNVGVGAGVAVEVGVGVLVDADAVSEAAMAVWVARWSWDGPQADIAAANARSKGTRRAEIVVFMLASTNRCAIASTLAG